jgi:hypothetical protein
MKYSSVVKSVLICFAMLFATIPLFSQTMITIDRDKLQQIINEEVQKGISQAVDAAVAIAVKAEEIKYIGIIADKDKIIADKQLEIDKLTIQNNLLTIQKQNIQLAFDDYKKTHGLGRDLIVGGLSFSTGFIGSLMVFLFTLH